MADLFGWQFTLVIRVNSADAGPNMNRRVQHSVGSAFVPSEPKGPRDLFRRRPRHNCSFCKRCIRGEYGSVERSRDVAGGNKAQQQRPGQALEQPPWRGWLGLGSNPILVDLLEDAGPLRSRAGLRPSWREQPG